MKSIFCLILSVAIFWLPLELEAQDEASPVFEETWVIENRYEDSGSGYFVRHVAFTPDSSHLLIHYHNNIDVDDILQLYDLTSGELVSELRQSVDTFTPLAWDPRGSKWVTWNPSGTAVAFVDLYGFIRVWKVDGFAPVYTFIIPGRLEMIAWNYDGSLLAVSGWSGRLGTKDINLYDGETGDLYLSFEDQQVTNFSWHPAENVFALSDTSKIGEEAFQIVDATTGEIQYTLPGPENLFGHGMSTTFDQPTWRHDGRQLVATPSHPIPAFIWDIETREILAPIWDTETYELLTPDMPYLWQPYYDWHLNGRWLVQA